MSRRLAALALLLPTACAPSVDVDDGGPGADGGGSRTAFTWRTIDAPGLPPAWGAFVAAGLGDGAVRVGGTEGGFGPVVARLVSIEPSADGVAFSEPGALDGPRYCGCAMLDEGRGEVIAFGGRDGDFLDAPTATVIDLAAGTATALDDTGAADAPVGCAAFFLPDTDKGYVFGGLSSGGGFSAKTWRYDPVARTFTELALEGPAGRYDAAVKLLDGSTAILASGMGSGMTGARFYGDVWRFDGATETWSEVEATNDGPPGRRAPFFALAQDHDTLVFGYGSDAPRGDSVKDDLWTFTLSTGAWAELDVKGEAPTARGFAQMLPGPLGSVGLIAGGFDGYDLIDDGAHVLDPPDALAGTWR